MARALSVGTRWALLYTFVTSIALSLPIGFIYLSVKHQIERDARLLLDSYLAEVRSEVEAHPGDPEVAVGAFTMRLRRIIPELDYGAALLRPDGSTAFRVGSLDGAAPLLLTRASGTGPAAQHPEELGGRQDYLLATAPTKAGILVAGISSGGAGDVEQIRHLIFVAAPLGLALSALCGAWLRPAQPATDRRHDRIRATDPGGRTSRNAFRPGAPTTSWIAWPAP